MNIDVLVWRAEEVDTHGDLITPAALQEMADGIIPGSAIPLNGDIRNPVGYVVAPWIVGKNLYVTAQIADPGIIDAIQNGRATIRPGFEIIASHTDNVVANKRVIDSIGHTHVSVTTTPMHLPGDG